MILDETAAEAAQLRWEIERAHTAALFDNFAWEMNRAVTAWLEPFVERLAAVLHRAPS